ncbi:hypothetical protein [Streptomyces sp. XY413]|uniref:hypothetical protein n=1 Tax=Streptomyces sp. XY413 TaxID=1519479 RepID=UPI000A4D2166|nr:hypothetical protein [Streptomyces sp. XY413]
MTYSARRYEPLVQALREASVQEWAPTSLLRPSGEGSAMSGTQPASAFSVAGAQIWHWPVGNRTEPGAKSHAKPAEADRRTLLAASANFTQAGVDRTIEAGVLIKGGPASLRTVEHVRELQRSRAFSGSSGRSTLRDDPRLTS